MRVTMTFDGTNPEDRYDFVLLATAFSQRGGMKDQKLPKAERRSDTAIKHAMDAISAPRLADDAGKPLEAPKPGWPDLRPRQLQDGAGLRLDLEQPEFERLQRFFDSEDMVWHTEVVDRAEEMSHRIAAAFAAALDQKAGPKAIHDIKEG